MSSGPILRLVGHAGGATGGPGEILPAQGPLALEATVAGLEAPARLALVGNGTLSRAELVLAPSSPNNEGYPSSAPANGPSVEHLFGSTAIIDNNHVHANPYPNVGGPGQPKVCEAGNEGYEKGKALVGNLPASLVAKNREITSRSENLYGEKYLASTLKDLGLVKAKKATKKAKKGKRK